MGRTLTLWNVEYKKVQRPERIFLYIYMQPLLGAGVLLCHTVADTAGYQVGVVHHTRCNDKLYLCKQWRGSTQLGPGPQSHTFLVYR